MAKQTLVIAEKPSVAQSIADVLGVTNRKNGYLEGNGYLISWCIGHLAGLADAGSYDEKYQKWNQSDLPILPADWKYVIAPGKKEQFDLLKRLMNRSDIQEIICATDAGREGELIFRNVYYLSGCEKPFKRLWISSMEDRAIRDGFSHLREGCDYDNLYHSALSRAKADWLVGINATRLYTTLSGTLLRVGRVQTPVLAMLCDRAAQIEQFQKTPYWNVHLNCPVSNGMVSFHQTKLFDKQKADALLSRCQGQPVTITSVEKAKKATAPPRLYDLTTLQREANRYFGYTAQQVLDTVQKLYEKKLCTYPRTDSQFLTEDMEHSTLALLKTCRQVFSFAQGSNTTYDIKRCINNKKVTDHHAILPTAEIANVSKNDLTEKERNILSQIGMRLLCAVGIKHIYEDTNVSVLCAGETFTTKGRSVITPGWKQTEAQFCQSVKTYKNADKDNTDTPSEEEASKELPPLQKGQNFPTNHTTLTSHFTTPPKPYTEDTLLSAMETAGNEHFDEDTEKKGLGTPATRAGILEKLVQSGYVKRKGKSLLPTPEGVHLISLMPEELRSPRLTAEWENTLMQIERGEISAEKFLTGITDMVTALIRIHSALSPDDLERFMAHSKDSLGSCPWCGSSVYEGRANWCCSNPQCGFRLWKKSKFFESIRKPMTQTMAAEFLRSGQVHATGLYSNRTGKIYDADIVLGESTDKNGNRIVNFRLEFPEPKQKRSGYRKRKKG